LVAIFRLSGGITFVTQTFQDFVKMTLTRVSSHWLWLETRQDIR